MTGKLPQLQVQAVDTVRIIGRPEWARDGVMAANFLSSPEGIRVVGRGYRKGAPVDRSHLFQAGLEGYKRFRLDPRPLLRAVRDLAVEDPTVAAHPAWFGGRPVILYSRVYRAREVVTSDIWLAPAGDLGKKRPLVVARYLRWLGQPVLMVKEPEVLGDYLFYEVADVEASRIAVGVITPTGLVSGDKLFLDVRPGQWDSEHVSTGPILPLPGGQALMLYNGRGEGAWAIGALTFDVKTLEILSRSEEPLIRPNRLRGPCGQRIAFASGVVKEEGRVRLYYHEADRAIKVATISGI